MPHVLFAVECASTLHVIVADDRPLHSRRSLLISLVHITGTKSSHSAPGVTGHLNLWSVSYK